MSSAALCKVAPAIPTRDCASVFLPRALRGGPEREVVVVWHREAPITQIIRTHAHTHTHTHTHTHKHTHTHGSCVGGDLSAKLSLSGTENREGSCPFEALQNTWRQGFTYQGGRDPL